MILTRICGENKKSLNFDLGFCFCILHFAFCVLISEIYAQLQ